MSEAYSNVAMLFLVFLPLAMAAIGWVAATATARMRSVGLTLRNHASTSTPKTARRAAEGSRSRTIGPWLLGSAVVVMVVMAVAFFFEAR